MIWISVLGTDLNFAQVINFEPKLENNYRMEDTFQGNAKIYLKVLSIINLYLWMRSHWEITSLQTACYPIIGTCILEHVCWREIITGLIFRIGTYAMFYEVF